MRPCPGPSLGAKCEAGSGKVWAKWLLRKAFEGYLPAEIMWREKTTIDWGTGAI